MPMIRWAESTEAYRRSQGRRLAPFYMLKIP